MTSLDLEQWLGHGWDWAWALTAASKWGQGDCMVSGTKPEQSVGSPHGWANSSKPSSPDMGLQASVLCSTPWFSLGVKSVGRSPALCRRRPHHQFEGREPRCYDLAKITPASSGETAWGTPRMLLKRWCLLGPVGSRCGEGPEKMAKWLLLRKQPELAAPAPWPGRGGVYGHLTCAEFQTFRCSCPRCDGGRGEPGRWDLPWERVEGGESLETDTN